MADSKESKMPHPKNPITPDDYNPTHDKNYPHGQADIKGDKDQPLGDSPRYEDDVRDEEGRPAGMRRTGEFIVPDENNITGEGWTLPTRAGGGWDKALDTSLEEQIEEPETPNKTNQK